MDVRSCMFTTEGDQSWHSVQDVMNSFGSLTLFSDSRKELEALMATAGAAPNRQTNKKNRNIPRERKPTGHVGNTDNRYFPSLTNGWISSDDISYSAGRGERMNQLEKRLKPFLRDAEVQKQLREACGSGYSNELIEYYWANREKQPSDRVSQYPSGQFEDCMEGPSSNSRSRSWDTGKRRSGKGRRTFGRCEENSVLSDDASDPAIIIEKTICFKPRAAPRATPVEKSHKAVETPTALRLEQDNIPSNNATQEVPVEDSLEFDNCSLILSAGEESNVGERKDKQKKKKRRKWLKEEELRAEGNARAPKGGAGEEGIASCLFRGRDCRTAEQKLCPGMKSVPRCRNALIRGLELMRDRNNAANQLGGPGEGFPPLLKTPEQFLQPASPISPKLLPSSQFLMDSIEFPPL